MAVVQAVFHFERVDAFPVGDFSYQVRQLVVPEASSWESPTDVVVDWGDPACSINPESIVQAAAGGHSASLFGRSWLHFHRPTQTLTFAVDRLGMFPILLAHNDFSALIASDIPALSQLLGIDARPDPQALVDLLGFGQLLGENSVLRGVQHLYGGTIGRMSGDGQLQLQHAMPFGLPETLASASQGIEVLITAMDKRLRADPEALLHLRGDLESLTLLAAALAAGHRPRLLYYGDINSPELKLVEQAADAVDAELYIGILTPQHFHSARYVTAQLGGGEVPLYRSHALVCAELVARTRGTTLITSTGGQLYRGLSQLPFENHVMQLKRAFPHLIDPLKERLQSHLEMYSDEMSVYFGEILRRRDGADLQILMRDYARSHPFLDPEVIDVLSGLPIETRRYGHFYRQVLDVLNPNLARLPCPRYVREETTLYPLHLNGSSVNNEPLWLYSALQNMGLCENEIQYGTKQLLQDNEPDQRVHFTGILGAYNGWATYLANRQTTYAS
ncbi:MAG: hypothetical protein RIT27_17 [Pseudomonadota bacterium]|jgi:asparagine synthase (glutamine-hydrolysing)